ncbi:MAG TPA: carboxypeptidase-like regulatory domain-containing protein, partial [Bryobacteraceae bacterium]|nr:carboxypeptidase-like regulatory domain-containing protein [Bryobacteraceae bacterium]
MKRFALFLTFTTLGLAQVDTGTIAGIARDPSGSAVPTAHIEINHLQTGQKIQTVTNNNGLYVSPPLRPGDYTVTIEAT